MNMELQSDSVVVLPLLLEECKIPRFLEPKLYADFSSPDLFAPSLEKVLRRLAFTDT